MSRILSRLFAPVLERNVLLRAVGHVFFQSLIIASQFGVTYLVVRLIENMNRPDVFPEVMREVYIGLIGMGFLVLYLFIHCRYTTTGNVRSLLNQRVRTESIGAFLRSSGHTSGLTPTGKTISIFQEGIQSW